MLPNVALISLVIPFGSISRKSRDLVLEFISFNAICF